MPLYEYRCSSCGHQQEFLQKWSDAPITVCTSCGKESFQKMLTAAGFQLKGSGWYATDFKNSGAKPSAKPDAKSTTASGGKDKGDVKPDTKPDAKPDTKPDAKPDKKSENKSESKSEAVASGADVRP